MTPNYEVGSAKSIANLNLLNTNIIAVGTTYNPTNPALFLINLQRLYTDVFHLQESVNNLTAPYAIAVDEREQLFKPLNSELTKLRKVYQTTEGVTQVQLDDFMTLVRKLKGVRKKSLETATPLDQTAVKHSISQMSYDQRTNNLDLLIALLQNTPHFRPNEVAYQIATYQAKRAQMLLKTQAVADIFVSLNNARSVRNAALYDSEDNLIDTANKAKNYLFTILDPHSAQYKAIARILFRKRSTK